MFLGSNDRYKYVKVTVSTVYSYRNQPLPVPILVA